MPVLVVSRDFRPAFNTSSGSTHLKGNVREKIKVTFEVEVTFQSIADKPNNGVEFTIDGNKITRNNGSFIKDEFSVGDNFDFRNPSSGASQFTGTVSTVTDTQIIFSTTSGAPIDDDYPDATLFGLVQKNGLVYNFGLVENNDPEDFTSPVTKQPTSFYATDINGAGAGGEVMSPLGQELQWYAGATKTSAKVTSTTGYGTTRAVYTVEHEFYIQAWFLEEYIENLENKTIPELFEDGSIKYISEFEFRSSYSNPNSAVSVIDSQQLGSVGWRDQNFNGFNNGYSIESISYEDLSSNGASGLLVGEPTKVTIIANSSNSSFTSNTRVGLYYSLAPTSIKYRTDKGNFNDIWSPDEAYGLSDSVSFSGSSLITSVVTNLDSSDQITIEAVITVPSGFTAEDSYLIDLQLEKEGVTLDTSDKVMIGSDYNIFDKSADIKGLIEDEEGVIISHNIDYESAPKNTDFKGWIQDGVVFKFGFNLVNITDPIGDPLINSIEIKTIAYNSTSGHYFELDSFPIPLNSAIIQEINGQKTQQINLDSTRGFDLAPGDPYNYLKFVNGDLVGNKLRFDGEAALKFAWQDWVRLPNADTVFLNNSLPNKGLNKNISNYSLKEGYAIKITSDLIIKKGESLTDYRIQTPNLQILDFENDGNNPTQWIGIISTASEDGSIDYEGAISTNSITKFQINWINSEFIDTEEILYAIHRAEPSNSSSDKSIQELSSVRDFPINDVLQPINGESFLRVTKSIGSVITECLIDPSKMNIDSLNISGRLAKGIFAPYVLWDGLIETGGATGIMDIDMLMSLFDNSPMTSEDTIRIRVNNDSGDTLEILEGDYGSDISTFVTDLGANPQTTSINNVSAGLITNAGTLSLPKITWANAQSPPKINELSTKLYLGIQGELPNGAVSEYDEIVVPFIFKNGQQTGTGGAYRGSDLGDIFMWAGTGAGYRWFPYEGSFKESYSLQVHGTFSQHGGYFYDQLNDVLYTAGKVTQLREIPSSDFIYNGGTGAGTQFTWSPYQMAGTPLIYKNGKPVLLGSFYTNLLTVAHWDGSTWINSNWKTEIYSQIAMTAGDSTFRISIGKAGDIFLMMYNLYNTNMGIIRGDFTGSDPSISSHWTFSWIMDMKPGVTGAYVDGDGTVASWGYSITRYLADYELDSNGKSVIYLGDSLNANHRLLRHNGGTDINEAKNWTMETPSWGSSLWEGSSNMLVKINEDSAFLIARSSFDLDPKNLINTKINNGTTSYLPRERY